MGSISSGAVPLVISAFVAWRVRPLLVGRSANPEIQETIDEVIAARPGVEQVFRVATMQFGPDTLPAVKAPLDPAPSPAGANENINAMERALKARVSKLKSCFVEPDVADWARSGAQRGWQRCQPLSAARRPGRRARPAAGTEC